VLPALSRTPAELRPDAQITVCIIPPPPYIGPMYDSLVTGCAGFIGSHLTERLLERGDRVLGIDSFEDYYSAEQKERNLTAARGHAKFTFLRGNVREVPLQRFLTSGIRVFHLAAQPGVRGSWGERFPVYVNNNVLATQAILEAVVAADTPVRFVYASSSSIYGETADGPTPEDSTPAPVSPYGMTKLAGEHLVRLYRHVRGLSAVSLRFFSVYGPRQRPDMACHRFFQAVREKVPIEVYGDGHQVRDFTFVDDIVAGIIAASDPAVEGDVFNLGAGAPERLDAAIGYIEETVGEPLKIQRFPSQAGDARSTWSDTRRARRLLHYRPRVSLREGLKRQWEWHMAEGFGVPVMA
jgi:nucleoside-diphosphate-sugar epimerase